MGLSQKDPAPQKKSQSQKYEETTAAALEIIDRETDERERKTARLRALRLAREAAETTAPKRSKR